MRRTFAILSVLLAVACGPDELAAERPSIVVISIDTLRADALGAYGQTLPTSPAFDAFAKESVVFTRCYSQAPQTAPSHMSLFTSLYPTVHQVGNRVVDPRARKGEVMDNPFLFARRLNPAVTTLAGALRDAGWRTAAFVSGGNLNRECGHDQGFELFDQDPSNGMNGNLDRLFDFSAPARWIEEHADERLFLFLHTYIPHSPYLPPAPWNTAFDPDYAGGILGDRESYPAADKLEYSTRTQRFWGSVDRDDPRDVRHLKALYEGDVRYGDDALATMLAELKRTGLWERAIVVVLSDHGEEFAEHKQFEHPGELYREHVHVPLAIHFPGGKPDTVRQPVRLLDVMPTLLELAHVPVPQTAQGTSLVPFLSGEGIMHPVISENVFVWNAPDQSGMTLPKAWVRTVRTGSWTFVQRVSPDERKEELYETQTDPGEQKDVSAEPENLDRLERFRALVRAHETTCERMADRLAGREPAPMSEETMRELEALGYVGDAK